jgi:hypothetical protein
MGNENSLEAGSGDAGASAATLVLDSMPAAAEVDSQFEAWMVRVIPAAPTHFFVVLFGIWQLIFTARPASNLCAHLYVRDGRRRSP